MKPIVGLTGVLVFCSIRSTFADVVLGWVVMSSFSLCEISVRGFIPSVVKAFRMIFFTGPDTLFLLLSSLSLTSSSWFWTMRLYNCVCFLLSLRGIVVSLGHVFLQLLLIILSVGRWLGVFFGFFGLVLCGSLMFGPWW